MYLNHTNLSLLINLVFVVGAMSGIILFAMIMTRHIAHLFYSLFHSYYERLISLSLTLGGFQIKTEGKNKYLLLRSPKTGVEAKIKLEGDVSQIEQLLNLAESAHMRQV